LLTTWTVTDNSDNPGDTGSLRYAIDNAPSGTTIDFAPSVANPITLMNGALASTMVFWNGAVKTLDNGAHATPQNWLLVNTSQGSFTQGGQEVTDMTKVP
jgi:hypothetical protein